MHALIYSVALMLRHSYDGGNIDLIKSLIAKGDIGIKNDKQRTLLHQVCLYHPDDSKTIKTLVSQGADPNAKDIYGYTPAHFLCIHRVEGTMELLGNKANFQIEALDGLTPIGCALIGVKKCWGVIPKDVRNLAVKIGFDWNAKVPKNIKIYDAVDKALSSKYYDSSLPTRGSGKSSWYRSMKELFHADMIQECSFLVVSLYSSWPDFEFTQIVLNHGAEVTPLSISIMIHERMYDDDLSVQIVKLLYMHHRDKGLIQKRLPFSPDIATEIIEAPDNVVSGYIKQHHGKIKDVDILLLVALILAYIGTSVKSVHE